MRISDGYETMMQMPIGHMGLGLLFSVLILLAIGFGIGYFVGHKR